LLHEPAAEALLKHIADLVRRGPRRLVLAVLVLGAAVIAGACETSSTITTTPDPVKCQVSLGTTPMVEAVGGNGTLAVTTQPECAWEASTSASWISGLSPASGQGTGNLAFRVAPNEGTASREGTIVVNGQQARVSQRAVCRYELAPASQTIATSGGTSSVTITTSSDCPWTATTGASWITLTPPFTGSGSATLRFSVVGNPGSGRTASIVVAGQQATVIQSAADTTPPCNAGHIALSPTSQNVGAAGGTGSTTVSTNTVCLWSAVSNVPWITITSDANGIGNGSVAFSVTANTGVARTGTLAIAGHTFTVIQAAGAAPQSQCTYTIAPANQNFPVLGGVGTVNVTAVGGSCSWTAASNAAWITVTSGTPGNGNGSVAFSVAQNPGAARTGTIAIASQTFTVTQNAVLGGVR
jgi:hypothetical protein